MKIKSYKKLKDNCYKIIFENDENIILYDELILKYNLLIYKQIDKNDLLKLKKENKSLECYYKAIKYLAYKDRCKREIENYLKRFSYDLDDIEKTINRLEKENILNQNKYLKSYINEQVNLTSNGPLKIERKLIELGFEKSDIENELQKIDKDIWLKKLDKIIEKKIKANKKDSVKKMKERVLYNCLNEGFKKNDIENVLKKYDINDDNSLLEKEAKKIYQKLRRKYEGKELFYQLKNKLFMKGFQTSDIDSIIKEIFDDNIY